MASSPAPAEAGSGPVATGRLRLWLAAVIGAVAVVVFLDSSGVLTADAEVIVDNAAQLTAGAAAALACLLTARSVEGPERAWRVWMGLGMVGWTVGQACWSWFQVVADTPLPSPSVADIGYLTMPVFAVPALLALAVEPHLHRPARPRGAAVVYLLDGVIVVGSLFTIAWATSLGVVVRSEVETPWAFVVAVAYPTTDLILVVIVVLLAVTRRVPAPLRRQLWLLGSGLVAIAVSDSIFTYIVAHGLDEMPPVTNAGFILGPLLVALAGLTLSTAPAPAADHPGDRADLLHPSVERAHLLLPYALVGLTAVVAGVQLALDAEIDVVEMVGVWLVLVVALLRQMITLVENTTLLQQVSAAQVELSHRAHHDPLTGLANRALFNERLVAAIDRHAAGGETLALLVVDLDDFKAVNDTYGHAAGDRLLQDVGDRLRSCVRSGDTVARLGGDEFAVVLEAGAETPGIVAQRMLVALHEPFSVAAEPLSVGASVGVVEPARGEPGLTPDVLLHRADEAMYAGKRRGKGVIVHYRADDDASRAVATAAAVHARGVGAG